MKRKPRLFHGLRPKRTIPLALFVVFLVLILNALILNSAPAHAQGCTQCLDNTAATPPKMQAAYRHAILFMTTAAGSIFLGTLILLKRNR